MSLKRVLIGAPMMPAFDRESGSRRIFDLITLLQEAGWAVSFVAENTRDGERYAHLLQQRGVAVYSGFDKKVEQLLARGRLDLVVFAFWHLAESHMPMVRRISPNTHIIIDTIDLHFVRNARRLFQAARVGQLDGAATSFAALDARYGSELIRELNTYAAADGVLALSQKEAALIGDLSDDEIFASVMPDCEDIPPSSLSRNDRRGIAFIGNFRHPPNVGAAEFLCREIVPLIDPLLLEQHPVYVVGNALDDRIRAFADGHPNIRLVGWVPSVLPYLEQARVSVVPLLYGAGTKRKMLQALMLGTPTVSTTAGIEGLDLSDGEHVLVATDAAQFAASVERVLRETALWERLSRQGREHIAARHGRDIVRVCLLKAISSVLSNPVKGAVSQSPDIAPSIVSREQYRELVERVRQSVAEVVPEGTTVAVTSRGDEELLKMSGRRGWHFPQNDQGLYAGHYPRDGAAAVKHLEELRGKGADFLVFPKTAMWWLDHYRELKEHLEQHYREILRSEASCVVFDVRHKS